LLGWDYSTSLLLASAIIIVYTATGGFLAVTYTDWVQFALLFIGIVIIGIPIAIANGGTWEALSTELPAEHFNPTGWGVATMLALGVSLPLSFFVAMDNYTRMFAARNEQVAKRGTLLATVFLLPIAVGTVWIGMTAVLTHPGIENGDSVLSTFVMDAFPPGRPTSAYSRQRQMAAVTSINATSTRTSPRRRCSESACGLPRSLACLRRSWPGRCRMS